MPTPEFVARPMPSADGGPRFKPLPKFVATPMPSADGATVQFSQAGRPDCQA